MEIEFFKYQGTGNDFVMIDNRSGVFEKNNITLIQKMCNRKFGIGADGLILLENDVDVDFRMVYFNADGNQSSMCGNGGRCMVAFAKKLKIIGTAARFVAIDGLHHAEIDSANCVSLQMKDIDNVSITDSGIFVNSGSPHHIVLVDRLELMDVKKKGAAIRYSKFYENEGVNVNFVQQETENTFSIRTYERGVEDETLSCGTGATAVAVAMNFLSKTKHDKVFINVLGGKLEINFDKNTGGFCNIFLKGDAVFVYSGIFFD